MDLVVDGKKVYAYTAGKSLDAKRPSVVFIHGAANDHSASLLQTRYFAYHGCNALAFDLPGHGRSRGRPLASIGALADWIVAALDAAGIEQAALVGHSMGSLAALECAARHPERVRALALVGTAAPMYVGEPLLNAARERPPRRARHDQHLGSLERRTDRRQQRARDLDDGRVPAVDRAREAAGPVRRPQSLRRVRRRAGVGGQGEVPHAVHPRQPRHHDAARNAKDLRNAIAGSRTVMLEGAGHALTAERPGAVLDALIGFVA